MLLGMATVRIIEPSPKERYFHQVRISECIKLKSGLYALPDHNAFGTAMKNIYVIVRSYPYYITCSCQEADCWHTEYLCRHLSMWANEYDDTSDETNMWIVSPNLFGIYDKYDGSIGLVNKSKNGGKITCFVCNDTKCRHVKIYRANTVTELQEDNFSCLSSNKIPYPMVQEEKYKYLTQYPQHLVPKYSRSNTCKHNRRFNDDCPIENRWVASDKSYIYDARHNTHCIVYYRPTRGDECECRQFYDGRDDLILNLNNTKLFSYAWLLDILHYTQETRFPLHAAFRAVNRSREEYGLELLKEYMYNHLRNAYNCYLRLLDLDFKFLYKCSRCTGDDRTIVVDGVMMGCRQDRMPVRNTSCESNTIAPIAETTDQRPFIKNKHTRTDLSKYAGLSRGRYMEPEEMEEGEFRRLSESLSDRRYLKRVVDAAGSKCPSWLQKLAGELSRGSPTFGVIQLLGKETKEAYKVLKNTISGDIVNFDPHREILEMSCPLLVDFIFSGINTKLILDLLMELLNHMDESLQGLVIPEDHYYDTPKLYDENLEVFPNNPQTRGRAQYKADKKRNTQRTCTKDTKKHKKLSSGICTMICPHGICIGFQLMDVPESPRTSFDLLVRRFGDNMPRLILYDNACHLQQYAMKREPKRFKNTRFMIDRMHSKNHKCTEGYSMRTYSKDLSIEALNSQVCEQTNSHLRRIATQLAYMQPRNAIFHVKIFLAIRNMDKLKSRNLYVDEDLYEY